MDSIQNIHLIEIHKLAMNLQVMGFTKIVKCVTVTIPKFDNLDYPFKQPPSIGPVLGGVMFFS